LWSWEAVHVPLRNYAMWFIASFAFNYFYQSQNEHKENKAAIPLFASIAIFFFVIDVLVIW